jgi:hypothetical protein
VAKYGNPRPTRRIDLCLWLLPIAPLLSACCWFLLASAGGRGIVNDWRRSPTTRAALAAGVGSMLILDLGAHCGGGTASLIEDEPRVWQIDVSVSSYDRYSG